MQARLIAVTLGASLCCALGAYATEFQPIGYDSVAMGGAGVASARGTMAGYYNPALLAKSKRGVELSAGGGVGVTDNGLLKRVNDLSDDSLTGSLRDALAGLSINTPPSFSADLRERLARNQQAVIAMANENPQAHAALQPFGELGVQLGSFSVGAYATSDALAQAEVDPAATELIFAKQQNTVQGLVDVYFRYNPETNQVAYAAYQNGNPVDISGEVPASYTHDATLNETAYQTNSLYYATYVSKRDRVAVSGTVITEVPVSFATKLGGLAIGASIKPMQGDAVTTSVDIDTSADALKDAYDEQKVRSTAFGVDAGILYTPPFLKGLTLGAVGKNLNKPSFKDKEGVEMFSLEPMYRAGLNLNLGSMLDIAADYDLSVNKAADGTDSQYVGGGMSLKVLPFLTLRGGAMQNLKAADKDEVIYTLGAGVGLKWAQLNVAAQASNKKITVDGEESPRSVRLAVSFVSRW